MICSHSIYGDLHGVQLDLVLADILRKGLEQETFMRLKITPNDIPSIDEVEVYKILQECLELRQSYLFREEIAPWEKEIITDPSTPRPNPDPFAYAVEQKTDVSLLNLMFYVLFVACFYSLFCVGYFNSFIFPFLQHIFQTVDGVVHVYPNAHCKYITIHFDSLALFVTALPNRPHGPSFDAEAFIFFQPKKGFILLLMPQPFSRICITYFGSLQQEISVLSVIIG